MRVISVTIQNFGPYYGRHTFELSDRGLTLVMGENLDESAMDSNGSGKSYAFEALDWCWFGKPTRGGLADSILNEEAFLKRGAECFVETKLLTDSSEEMVIKRGRSKTSSTLMLRVGAQDYTTLDTNETQRLIEQHLGMDRTVFHAAIFFAQTDLVRYADSLDADRMNILTKLLSLGDIDIFAERAKDKLKAEKQLLEKIERDKIFVDGRIAGMQNVDFSVELAKWEKDRDVQRQDFGQQIAGQDQLLFNLQLELGDSKELCQRKDQLNRELAAVQAPAAAQEEVNARKMLGQIAIDLGIANHEIISVKQRRTRMVKFGKGTCSECGQVVTAEHLSNEICKLDNLRQIETSKINTLTKNQQEWQDYLVHWEAEFAVRSKAHQEQCAVFIQQVTLLDTEILGVNGKQQRYEVEVERVDNLKRQLIILGNDVNPYLAKQKEHTRAWDMLHHQAADIDQAHFHVGDAIDYLEFWVKSFGPQGLKSYILDSQLQVLTDAANQWLKLLTGGTMWVRFESQKRTKKKTLVNAPDIRIFRWNPDNTITERAYRDWSGGEKKRISFAIDFGISRLMATRAKKSYDILILDEVFKHLDRSGREAVIEMLQVLAGEKSSVFVIEHDAEFQGMFENVFKVVRSGRRSAIEEVADGRNLRNRVVVDSDRAEPIMRYPVV